MLFHVCVNTMRWQYQNPNMGLKQSYPIASFTNPSGVPSASTLKDLG